MVRRPIEYDNLVAVNVALEYVKTRYKLVGNQFQQVHKLINIPAEEFAH